MNYPADANIVGLLSLVMCAFGILFAVILLAVVLLNRTIRNQLPSKPTRATYWLGTIVLFLPILAAVFVLSPMINATAVIATFGWDAYGDGLTVVNKHGLLSDGRYLGVFWSAAIGAFILPLYFLLSIPFATWHVHIRERLRKSAARRNPKIMHDE